MGKKVENVQLYAFKTRLVDESQVKSIETKHARPFFHG